MLTLSVRSFLNKGRSFFISNKTFGILIFFLFFGNLQLSGGSEKKESPTTFPSRMIQQFVEWVKVDLEKYQPHQPVEQIESASPLTKANLLLAPCPGGSGVIGGTVFHDFNYNGLNDQSGGGIAGITVYLFGCTDTGEGETIENVSTDENGNYFFSGLTDGETYRVEFHIPEALNYLQSGFNGADSRTTVQFVNSPDCTTDLGLSNPIDYCEEDPFLAIPCYVNGDPLAEGSGSAEVEALVQFKTSYENSTPTPTLLATGAQIGASFGFISVDAVSIGEQNVKVSWETENEKGKGNYVVEHALDGENFEVIGRAMEGKGPVSTASYDMEETVSLGKNYFRIKYLDEEENVFFSEIVEIVILIPEGQSRNSLPSIIYPNPVHNQFVLDFTVPIQASTKVTISSIYGKILKEIVLEPGTVKQTFDIADYDSGVYEVSLQQRRKKLITYKLVKSKK